MKTFLNAFSASIPGMPCSYVHMFNLTRESYIVFKSIIRSLLEGK